MLLPYFHWRSVWVQCPETELISMNSVSPSVCSSARVISPLLCFPSFYGFQIFLLFSFFSSQLIDSVKIMECVCVCVRTTHPLCVQSKYTNCHQQIYLVFSNESQRAALYVIISKQQITNDLI